MDSTTQFLNIFHETIGYYNKTNRSIDGFGTCKYKSDNGNMCALGRCLTEESLELFHSFEDGGESFSIDNLPMQIEGTVDQHVKAEYKGLSNSEWTLIQSLHDNISIWTDSGADSDYLKRFIYSAFPTDYYNLIYPEG